MQERKEINVSNFNTYLYMIVSVKQAKAHLLVINLNYMLFTSNNVIMQLLFTSIPAHTVYRLQYTGYSTQATVHTDIVYLVWRER